MAVIKFNCFHNILRHEIKMRLISLTLRAFSTSQSVCANHYDVLEITPKATQGDIKSAYYKLSKVYHPDRSTDEASAKKFRAITEAYEILGNIKLKKLYDKGLMVGHDDKSHMAYKPEPEPTDPTVKFYKSRVKRQVTPTMEGRSNVYDFDTWAKQHYGDLFQKGQYEREILRTKRRKHEEKLKSHNQEALIYLIFAIGGLFTLLVANGTSDYDIDKVSEKKSPPPPASKSNTDHSNEET